MSREADVADADVADADVRAWLKYAEADYRSAYNAMAAADYRDVAFHCQQAVEKLLKAVIVRQTNQRPPYVHNLWQLWQHISGIVCPPDIQAALAALNPHYFLSRYPGVGVEYDLVAARELIERVERVWQWLTRTVNLAGE